MSPRREAAPEVRWRDVVPDANRPHTARRKKKKKQQTVSASTTVGHTLIHSTLVLHSRSTQEAPTCNNSTPEVHRLCLRALCVLSSYKVCRSRVGGAGMNHHHHQRTSTYFTVPPLLSLPWGDRDRPRRARAAARDAPPPPGRGGVSCTRAHITL